MSKVANYGLIILRIINPQLPTLDINLIIFFLLPSFLDSILCQLASTGPRTQRMLKMRHGVLRKHLRNPIQHVLFILDSLKHISAFSEKLPCFISDLRQKEKARLGAVDLFFPHIILPPFIQIKACMIFLSIPLYLSHLTQKIREHLLRFGNCFMHIWGI